MQFPLKRQSLQKMLFIVRFFFFTACLLPADNQTVLLAQIVFEFPSNTEIPHCWCWSICVSSGVQPACICVCPNVCWLLPTGLYHCGKHAQSDTHINTLHKASLYQASAMQCCWHAVLPGPVWLLGAREREVRWSGPSLIRLHPPDPFSICVFLMHLHLYVKPSTV